MLLLLIAFNFSSGQVKSEPEKTYTYCTIVSGVIGEIIVQIKCAESVLDKFGIKETDFEYDAAALQYLGGKGFKVISASTEYVENIPGRKSVWKWYVMEKELVKE